MVWTEISDGGREGGLAESAAKGPISANRMGLWDQDLHLFMLSPASSPTCSRPVSDYLLSLKLDK